MTPADIQELREHWQAYDTARVEGGVGKIPTAVLNSLAQKMEEAASILSIFAETETTRYWLCLRAAELHSIIHHRQHKLRS